MDTTHLRKATTENFGAEMISYESVGGGASGYVYHVRIDQPPYDLAVKTAKHAELLKKECDAMQYISSLADIKLPRIFYESFEGENCYIIMEYFDGVDCADNYLLCAPRKIRLNVADQIADNIIKLQQVKGEKFGDLFCPVFDDWHDYYHPFVAKIIAESEKLVKEGILTQKILDAIKTGEKHYDEIFDEPISRPTLIHGDYWAKNIMIDRDYRLIGVVDPFNSMWADSEYELFALNAVYGKKLPVLESFLSKVRVSEKFFLKNSFYFLVSETYWVCQLHHDNVKYLMQIIREFRKQLKQFGIV